MFIVAVLPRRDVDLGWLLYSPLWLAVRLGRVCVKVNVLGIYDYRWLLLLLFRLCHRLSHHSWKLRHEFPLSNDYG